MLHKSSSLVSQLTSETSKKWQLGLVCLSAVWLPASLLSWGDCFCCFASLVQVCVQFVLPSIVSLGVGRLHYFTDNNHFGLLPLWLEVCLHALSQQLFFILFSSSLSSLFAFLPSVKPSADSPSSSLFPIFQHSSSCWLLEALLSASISFSPCSHQGLQSGGGTWSGQLGPCGSIGVCEHGKSGPPITAQAVQTSSRVPGNTKGTLPSICRHTFCLCSPVTQSLTMS